MGLCDVTGDMTITNLVVSYRRSIGTTLYLAWFLRYDETKSIAKNIPTENEMAPNFV